MKIKSASYFLKNKLRAAPIIGPYIYKIVDQLIKKNKWNKTKKEVLKLAKKTVVEDISLDVSIREGYLVFHNRNNSLINRGEHYEPEVQIALKTLINLNRLRYKHTVFADIGVNIGLHTLFILNNFPTTEIIAFDPSPFSYKYFELTIRFNKINNIRLEKVALSDKIGQVEFYNWGKESSADSLKDTKRVIGVTPKILKVPTVSLDSLAGLPPINVIKMDTEGAELSILRGAYNTIIKYQPFILLEFNKINKKAFDVNTIQIFEFLQKIDYSIFTLEFEFLSNKTFDLTQDKGYENYILLPNSGLMQLFRKTIDNHDVS